MNEFSIIAVILMLNAGSLFSQEVPDTAVRPSDVTGTMQQPAGCGTSLLITHVAGTVAPVTKTVTYGIVTGIPGEPTKCWISSNLGADNQALAVTDGTEASAGWYWQFNLKQGYKHDGTARTPASAWISNISENSDWTTANDPCALELGSGWRIPTFVEWSNVQGNTGGNWINWNGPWNSDLKLHAAGYLIFVDGGLYYRGGHAYYWSRTQNNLGGALYIDFGPNTCWMYEIGKSFGLSVRCLKDPAPPSTQTLQNIAVPDGQSSCYNATQTITVAGSGTTFTVETGGSATMIAGEKIQLLPGTLVHYQGYLRGYIAPTGPFCLTPSLPAVVASVNEPVQVKMEPASFSTFPNPTAGKFTLELNGETPVEPITVELYGMLGEKMFTEILSGERMHEFSLANNPAGVYFVRVISGNKTVSGKIIKQ